MQSGLDQQYFGTLLKTDPNKALKLLYDTFYDPMCHQVYVILKDEVVAEDIVQEVFMAMWKRKDDLDIQTSLEGYLRRSCRNRALNYIRDNAVKWEEDSVLENISADQYSTDELLAYDDLNSKIQYEISQLPEKCGLIFSLSRYEELTYNEIASQLDISVKTVENQISKALKILREKIFVKV